MIQSSQMADVADLKKWVMLALMALIYRVTMTLTTYLLDDKQD